MKTINSFTGKYSFLSNFYPSPITIGGRTFQTVEHWYQANKATNETDFKKIMTAKSPSIAKFLGRSISIRPDWEDIKLEIMRVGLSAKFARPDMKENLRLVSDYSFVEGNNWHDNYWGNCTCVRCASIDGQNMLGVMLSLVRDKYFLETIDS